MLFLSCFLGLTAGSGLLPLSSIQIAVQAPELRSQGSQDSLIKACTGQSVNLGAPQLTEADLKVLTSCSSEVIPQLLEALKSRNWKIRAISAYTLGLLGKQAESTVPALIDLLKDENADVRFVATQSLGGIDSEKAVPPLINALQDKDENVRFAVADALLQLGEKVQGDKLATFVRYLSDESALPVYRRRFTIADSLNPESKFAIPAYAEALGNKNWFIRERAASKLKDIRLDSIPKSILSLYFRDGYARRVFTDTFFRTNQDYLIRIVETGNSENLYNAIRLLGNIGSRKAIPALIKLLQNKKEASEVVVALGKIRAEDAIPEVLKVIQSSDDNSTIGLASSEDLTFYLYQIGFPDTALVEIAKSSIKEKSSLMVLFTIKKVVNREFSSEQSIKSLKDILESRDIDAIEKIVSPPLFASKSVDYVSSLNKSFQELGLTKTIEILKPILLLKFRDRNQLDADIYQHSRYNSIRYISSFGDDAIPAIIKSFSEIEILFLFANFFSFQEDLVEYKMIDNTSQEFARTIEFAEKVTNQIDFKTIQNLVEVLRTSQEYRDLKSVTDILGAVHFKQAAPLLVKILEDDNISHKTGIILALGNMKAEEASSSLIVNLKDKDPDIRAYSASALGDIGSIKALPHLIDALKGDPSEKVRVHAAWSLGAIPSTDAEPVLIASLKDKSFFVRRNALRSLGQIKSKQAIPYLIETLNDKDWKIRIKASIALKLIGTESIPYLIKVLRNDNNNSPALRTALKNKNADFRRSSIYALWQIGVLDSQSKNELSKIATDENENLHVRWMAAMALERSGASMEQFFKDRNLLSSKDLTPDRCPVDDKYESVSFPLDKLYLIWIYKGSKVDINQLVYAGRCVYNFLSQSGGDSYGFYQAFLNLLNRR
jgi:HEAT repeat protein